jgi:transposase
MYVRASQKSSGGKVYQYLQLCESYRNEKGQPRTKVLVNFGRLDQLDRKKIDSTIDALLKYSENPVRPRLSDIEHGCVRDFGDIFALVHIWGRLRLTESITKNLRDAKIEFDAAKIVQAMVINRACDPTSKLGILRWLETVYIPELRAADVSYQHLLRAMDALIGIKDEIEKNLYNQMIDLFSPDVDLVFYDITSSYFEGDGPEIAAHGYSRDHRPDLKQIVVALAVTREGFPIFHEVYPGNTADVSTVADAVSILSQRFSIRKTVVVADRGMISEGNVEVLDKAEFPYILGLRQRKNGEAEELYQKNLSGFAADPALQGLMLKETERDGIRYIQAHNPEVMEAKRLRRNERVEKIEKEINALEKRLQRGGLSEKDCYHKVKKAIEDRHMADYFTPKIEDQKVILYRNQAIWEREQYLDGKFFLKTNLPADEYPTAEIVKNYKQLQQVERAFRELKDFLKIRPIRHFTDERVKAHVFICVLAYLMEKIVEHQCTALPKPLSGRRALSLLSRLKAIECTVGDRSVTLTNRVDDEISAILSALGVPPVPKNLSNQ